MREVVAEGRRLRWKSWLTGLPLLLLGLASPECFVGSVAASEAWPSFTGGDGEALPVVLTSARVRQPQSEVPASVTVLDRRLIEASGAREVHELFRLVPGMSVALTDGNIPQVSYHGTQAMDTRRMLVLVDGRTEYLPGLARVRWHHAALTVEDIERIEVTRGPSAAAYGANAFTGVINIITRDPRDKPHSSIQFRGGSNGIRDGRAAAVTRWQGGAFRATVARHEDDGFDHPDSRYQGNDWRVNERLATRTLFEISPEQTLELMFGGSRNTFGRPPDEGLLLLGEYQQPMVKKNQHGYLQGQWQYAFSERHELKVNAFVFHSQSNTLADLCGIDPYSGQQDPGAAIYFTREARELFEAYNRNFRRMMNFIGLGPGGFSGDPDTLAEEQAFRQRYDDLNSQPYGPFCYQLNFDIEEETQQIEVQDTLLLGDWGRLMVGAGFRHDRGGSDLYGRGTHRNSSRRLFGNLELKPFDFLLLNAGGFWETDTMNGSFHSPRLAAILRPAPGHGIRYVYSEAVRTPDIYEQRSDFNYRAEKISSPYKPLQATLGWGTPELFVRRTSPGTFEAEQITSRELGYYGRFGTFEIDVRLFEEKLRDLISNALAVNRFNMENDGWVDHRGWETQIGWRPHQNYFLRVTAAYIDTETEKGREEDLAARESGSVMGGAILPSGWDVSALYHVADDYNGYLQERLLTRLGWRALNRGQEVRVELVHERDLSGEPQVFEANRYRDRQRYWLKVMAGF